MLLTLRTATEMALQKYPKATVVLLEPLPLARPDYNYPLKHQLWVDQTLSLANGNSRVMYFHTKTHFPDNKSLLRADKITLTLKGRTILAQSIQRTPDMATLINNANPTPNPSQLVVGIDLGALTMKIASYDPRKEGKTKLVIPRLEQETIYPAARKGHPSSR